MNSTLFRHVLVPIDGSACRDAAITFALRLSATTGELTFANVIDVGAAVGETSTPYGGDPTVLIEALQADRKGLFAAAMAQARAAGIPARTVDLEGAPDLAIVECSAQGGTDAIVMGTHGRRGLVRLALGSVADSVLRRARVPTFVLPVNYRVPSAEGALFHHIVAAVDESASASAAATYAVKLAAQYGARVTFVHAGTAAASSSTETALQHASARAVDAHIRSDVVYAAGRPSDAIVTTAAAVHADLIAVGTHGRTGPDRFVLGSVAQGVILASAVPVVVVHAD